jgi:hypothetical protein
MKYLVNKSLFKTIDNVSEALMFNLKIDTDEKFKISDFIINQQGKPYTYADTFAPTEVDLKNDLMLFTGEKIKTTAGKCHMIGEEAARVLRRLGLKNEKIKTALRKADIGLQKRIDDSLSRSRYSYGMYCCKSCSCAMWLNITSGGINNNTEFLKAGLSCLKKYHDNKGKWFGFPFYYTLYVLNEMNTDLAMDEMKYVARSLEEKLKRRIIHENKYELRRHYICEQILNKVNSN